MIRVTKEKDYYKLVVDNKTFSGLTWKEVIEKIHEKEREDSEASKRAS